MPKMEIYNTIIYSNNPKKPSANAKIVAEKKWIKKTSFEFLLQDSEFINNERREKKNASGDKKTTKTNF